MKGGYNLNTGTQSCSAPPGGKNLEGQVLRGRGDGLRLARVDGGPYKVPYKV